MKTILTVLFALICGLGLACSGFTQSFCSTQTIYAGHLVVKGAVVGFSTNCLQLSVIEVVRGVETRSVITVWDGTDVRCTGLYSMKVSGMAGLGDTILVVLPRIQAVQNPWDSIGDYRRPDYLFSTPVLKVQKDTLRGLVTGNAYKYGPLVRPVYKMSYADFRAAWSNTFDCSLSVGITKEKIVQQPVISQDGTKVQILFESVAIKYISVTSLAGPVIAEHACEGLISAALDFEHYDPGIYILNVTTIDGKQLRFKIIR